MEHAPELHPNGRPDAHDNGTLLGLYHGYDHARLVLSDLSRHYCRRARQELQVGQELARLATEPVAESTVFERIAAEIAEVEGLNRGAHTAVLAVLALVSDKVDALRDELLARCPELGTDLEIPASTPESLDAGR